MHHVSIEAVRSPGNCQCQRIMHAELCPRYVMRLWSDCARVQHYDTRRGYDDLGDVLWSERVGDNDSCQGINGAVNIDGTTIRFESIQYESIVIAEPFCKSLCHELPPEALEHSSLALQDC